MLTVFAKVEGNVCRLEGEVSVEVSVCRWRGGVVVVVVVAKDFSTAHVRAPGEGEPAQNFARDAPSRLSLISCRVKNFKLTEPGHISYNLNPKTSLY